MRWRVLHSHGDGDNVDDSETDRHASERSIFIIIIVIEYQRRRRTKRKVNEIEVCLLFFLFERWMMMMLPRGQTCKRGVQLTIMMRMKRHGQSERFVSMTNLKSIKIHFHLSWSAWSNFWKCIIFCQSINFLLADDQLICFGARQ